MEELTKQQIVLVTLLVSFVTSIATGIVTVALMDQAPQGVTQTINRVVERTIEKVTPVQNQAAVVTKETVVVKESDLIVSAVEKNSRSLVSIYALRGSGDAPSKVFLGNGLVVSKDGKIVADSSIVTPVQDENGSLITQTFVATLPDDTSVAVSVAPNDQKSDLVVFKPNTEKNKGVVFVPASLSGDSLKLGQTVIALGGAELGVGTGIVSGFSSSADSSSATTTDSGVNKLIHTDIRAEGQISGSILLNLSGEVVGLRAGSALGADGIFLKTSSVASVLKSS